MIYTGIYDAKLIYEEAQEATLSAGRLPLNVAAQAQAIQGGFSDALTAARAHGSSGANAEKFADPLSGCTHRRRGPSYGRPSRTIPCRYRTRCSS